mmetsp:Transcript_90698/g.265460  ORF Transcript_90698/g.265460 Transcript_90698/m.265460 type:complete len:221 (-) Transcript_90698:1045-1707(-)
MTHLHPPPLLRLPIRRAQRGRQGCPAALAGPARVLREVHGPRAAQRPGQRRAPDGRHGAGRLVERPVPPNGAGQDQRAPAGRQLRLLVPPEREQRQQQRAEPRLPPLPPPHRGPEAHQRKARQPQLQRRHREGAGSLPRLEEFRVVADLAELHEDAHHAEVVALPQHALRLPQLHELLVEHELPPRQGALLDVLVLRGHLLLHLALQAPEHERTEHLVQA